MGFLRKVGRKIKKGVKKLFGSKFGKILGGIGLSMMFLGGANALFGQSEWFKGMKSALNKINPFAKTDVTSAVETATQAMDPTTLEGVKQSAKLGVETLGKDATRKLTDIPFAELDMGQKIAKAGGEVKDFLIPDMPSSAGEFAADVTRQVGRQKVLEAIEGKPDIRKAGFGKTPEIVNAFEPSYMAEIQMSNPNIQANNLNELQQNFVTGTLSPQFLLEQERYYNT